MNAKDITFGEFLQRKREEKEITLRRMAEKKSGKGLSKILSNGRGCES